VSIERETFPLLIAGREPLYAYTTDDYWIDLGRPEHYLQSHHDVLTGNLPLELGTASDERAIAPSYLGRGVVIEPGARVGPYAVIGDRVFIGAGASVRDSVLWSGVRVEPFAQIEGAIIASDATIGRAARVMRGAVIGHEAQVCPEAVVPEGARVAAADHAPAV
jgi:NDP-sugar pyrophosphorylase family protein